MELDESLEENISANCARAMGEYEAATKEMSRHDVATLLPITRQWFRLGTTIWSDMWRAYNDLDQNELNTKLSTTNHVEAMWIEAIAWSRGLTVR